MKTRLVILTFLCTYSTSISTSEGTDKSKLYKFISDLISDKFSSCSLVVLEDQFKTEFDFYPSLNDQVFMVKYTSKFNNISLSTIVQASTEQYSAALPYTLSSSLRYSDQCMMAVIFVNKIASKSVITIRNVIAPTYMPIIRKDEHHYMFITSPENHEELLLMKELPHRVKFKIAVGLNIKAGTVSVSTVDFFGGENGTPQVLQFPGEYERAVDYFPDFLLNIRGGILQFSCPITKALVEPGPPDHLNNGKRGRWMYLIDKYLKPKFNFTYHMFLSTDKNGMIGQGGTGVMLPNGTWYGITGDLLYGRADFGVGFANTQKRAPYISFVDQHFDFGCLTFVTNLPIRIFSPAAIFWPFNLTTWFCVFGSCIAGLVFTLWVKLFLERFPFLADRSLSVPSQIRLLLAPFIQQDYSEMPSSPNSFRYFIGVWSFYSIVITTLYLSKLTVLLAFPVLSYIPETFEQLAFSGLQIGFMKHGDSALNTLKASTDPVYTTLVGKMEIITGVGLECLEKVITPPKAGTMYGCIAYDFDLIYLKERNFTDTETRKLITAYNGRTYNVYPSLGVEAYSIYRINFGRVIGYTMPAHLAYIWDTLDLYNNVRQEKREWWRNSNQTEKLISSPDDSEESSDNLSLRHILGVFYIYFASILLGTILFLGEYIFGKNKKRKWAQDNSFMSSSY